MSGLTFSGTQVASWIVDTGVRVAAEAYAAQPLYYPAVAEVVGVGPGAVSHPFKGDKSTTIVADSTLRERPDGAEIEGATAIEGFAPQGKIRQFSRKLGIPERDVLAAGANAQNFVGSIVSEFVRQQTRGWINLKNLRFAQFLTNGAKTAGDAAIYDGSYPGFADPHPALAYDGVSVFNTAHKIAGGSATFANHATGAALAAGTLDSALTVMTATNAVDETGSRISIMPMSIMVPPALRSTARQLLNSELLPGGAQNDINPNRGEVDVIVNPFLTDADGWFLFSQDRTVRVMDSGELSVGEWFDPSTKTYYVAVEGHFGLYLRDWRGVLARNLATS